MAQQINFWQLQRGLTVEPPPNAPRDHLQLLSFWMEVLATFKAEQHRLVNRSRGG